MKHQQEKAAREKAEAIEMKPEVREFLDFMAENPVFYHELMLYFQRFKMHNQMEQKESLEPVAPPALPDSS